MPDLVYPGQRARAGAQNTIAPFLISYTAINANSAAATTTELIAITTGSITFKNGRAYQIAYKGLYQCSVGTDQAQVRVRKTNISGTAFVDSFRLVPPAAAGNSAFYLANIATNTTGADITAALVGTYARVSGGTGNIIIVASATNPAYVEVTDVGPAADFSGASAIT